MPTIFPLSEKEKKSFLLIKDYDGRTPFHLGLVKYYKKWKEISQQTREASDQIIEKKRILEFLLESYDKVLLEADSSKQTPFHLAAKAGDVDSISVFLAKVSQDEIINSFDMKGQTALSYAVRVKSRAVEELLMRRIPEVAEHLNDPKKVFPDVSYHYMSDEERENKKLKFSENIDLKFKQAEKEIEGIR